MKKPTVYLLSLGCPKNLVDSELILGKLKDKRFVIKDEPRDVDLAIINTCSFIKEAKEESIEEIMDLIELKKKGEIKKLAVVGCLPQRYMAELKKELVEVDGFLGIEAWKNGLNDLVEHLVNTDSHRLKPQIHTDKNLRESALDDYLPRFRLTSPHYVYLKIAEGCDNFCSYCSISRIRGRLRSRPIEEIVKEAETLARSRFLREINLIGQDTTLYGLDLYGQLRLLDLLQKLDKIKSVDWIRVLYTHPGHFSEELIGFMAGSKKICRYIDLPLQHISDKILTKMGRKITRQRICELIKTLRDRINGVALRTAFIVGFPGENEADFRELIDFIQEIKFEHLGAFVYSREEDTPAYSFPEQVPEKLKLERYHHLLEVQKEISREILQGYLGKTLPVLIDEKLPEDNHTFLGRTEFEAPEVDGTVIIKDESLKTGMLLKARITGTWEYDLLAERV
jgi:ribosomal protein S12 methylthiotransferase